MTPYDQLDVLNQMKKTGLIPVFNSDQLSVCQQIVNTIHEAGCMLGEFTIRGRFPMRTFEALSEWVLNNKPEFYLGAGSVRDATTATILIHNCAAFVVGPILDIGMVQACNSYRVLCVPGCQTPTEMHQAEMAGCLVVKYFPGGVGGPSFFSALRGPSPWTQGIPTGKTNPANAVEWIKAGAFALGMGSELITKVKLEAGDFAGITRDIKDVLAIIQKAREGK